MIIGITGGLGTGTSTVAGYVASGLRAKLIDADRIARYQLKHNASLAGRIVSAFGEELLDRKGTIDRRLLAKSVFSSRSRLKSLCSITHPVIIAEIRKRIKKLYSQGFSYVVVDAPLLIESGFYKECDILIVVVSSLSLQLERALKGKNMGQSEALSRIRFQAPLCRKARYADYVIDNTSTLTGLKLKCRGIVKKIKTKK